jgi:GTP-binding protein HflX
MTSSPNPPRRRRAFLVGAAIGGVSAATVEEHLDELAALADTAGADEVGRASQARPSPDPKTFIGRGKAEEIAKLLPATGADLVIVDDDLSGSQAKNLETIFEREVIDRSGLILSIFERRARSSEARTQVELARARYELPRLAKRWGHLSRQAGGIGVRGGEGETQLEADRRVLRRKIARLERDLERIEKMRKVQRASRGEVPVVALAGYTNAGKSTLFNRLTRDGTLAEDRLFATLDSRLRRGRLPGLATPVVFADTVGFIRKLPHHLVASFRSTLEEVVAADLVVHVVDRSHPRWEEQREVAEEVLAELGVERGRIVTVFNKVDRLVGPIALPGDELVLSAANGQGVDRLCRRLSTLLRSTPSGARHELAAVERESAGAGDAEEAAGPASGPRRLSLPRAIE